MARVTKSQQVSAASELAYPIYLDTEMLISFLASLENGVSYSSEVAERYALTKEHETDATGKVSLPSIATLLGLTLSAQGHYKRQSSSEDNVESKFVREHTAASLFNRLRARMVETPGMLVQVSSHNEYEQLSNGDLIEMQGEVVGNPLKQIFDLLAMIGPYIGLDVDGPGQGKPGSSRPSRKTGQAVRPVPQLASLPSQATSEISPADIMRMIKTEVERSPIIDLLMEGVDGSKIVLTVGKELLSPEVEAYLTGGRFKVIGKVSAVVGAGQSISLLRRTVFGFGGRELAENMFGDFGKSVAESGAEFSLAGAVIDGPAIQLLPLAIYL